jgi:phosphoglycolate phosphatase/pyrophosphatase PpaX
MARGAGAHFAAAGWAYDVPEIAEFMKKNCDYYFSSVEELKALLDKT